jgi:serine/threonine protein kinase
MLEFNPFSRPSAEELLAYPLFKEFRNPDNEMKSKHKIHLDCDEGMFQYDYQNEEISNEKECRKYLLN